MVNKRIGPWQILILAAALSLTLIIPAAAQETVPTVIQPGEVIEVGSDPLVLDLINLRNPDTFNPITELRRYKDDNPGKKVERVIGVPNDGYFKISDQALNGKYGRYFAFSEKDGLIERSSVIFIPVQTPKPTESAATPTTATETETPAGVETTAPATTTAAATTTQASLPWLIAIAAVGITGLFMVAGRGER